MNNKEIAKLLRHIAASYIVKDERKFRFQILAYERAADSIEHSTIELKDLYKENKLDLLAGVGKSIKSHLEKLFRTGKVKHFEEVKKGIPESVFPLLEIPSFGPKKAYRLVKEFSLANPDKVVEDIEKIAREGKIAKLSGFGEKSQADILRAISEYKLGKDKTSRMVLPYAFELTQKILEHLKKSKAVIQVYPLGSLRRMMPTVGDIDIAAATYNPKEVLEHFISYPYRERVVEKGKATASILVSGGKQIDLMVQPPESFGSLLQHFTGSKDHNVSLREYALTKGLSLSEYGIKRKTKDARLSTRQEKLKIENYDSEEKFYHALDLQWIPPEIREDRKEIELAAKNQLPKLIQTKDIKGDLHIHSTLILESSHDIGQSTPEEMIKKACELSYDYIGFSEHNPSVSKHTKNQFYSVLEKRKRIIDQLNLSNKDIRIINLLEVDILADGSLAIDEKSASFMDALIVGIHSSLTKDKKTMTKRIINGLSHPKAKILAHPTGRILNQRAGYELDFKEIFNFCKKNNKALEINAWPNRLDLPDSMVKQAVEQKVKMIINTDSHEVSQMNLMKYGVAVARRGWATKDDILNTLDYNEFINWLKS